MSVHESMGRRSLNRGTNNLHGFYGNDELVGRLQPQHSFEIPPSMGRGNEFVNWSGDGRFLMVGQENHVTFWNPYQPKFLQAVHLPVPYVLYWSEDVIFMPRSHDLIAYSHVDDFCQSGWHTSQVNVFDINKQVVVGKVPNLKLSLGFYCPSHLLTAESQPNSLWFSQNEEELYTWDVREGKTPRKVIRKQRYRIHNSFDVCSPTSHYIAAFFEGSGCGCLFDTRMLGKSQKQVPVKTFAPGHHLRSKATGNYHMQFSPNGKDVLLISECGDFYVFDINSSQESLYSELSHNLSREPLNDFQNFSKDKSLKQSKRLRRKNYLVSSYLKKQKEEFHSRYSASNQPSLPQKDFLLQSLNEAIKKNPHSFLLHRERGDVFLKNLVNADEIMDLKNSAQMSCAYAALRDYQTALSIRPSDDQVKCDIVELLFQLQVCQGAKKLAGEVSSGSFKERVQGILEKYRHVSDKKFQSKNKLVGSAVDYDTFVPYFPVQDEIPRICNIKAHFFGPDGKYLLKDRYLQNSDENPSIYNVTSGERVKVLQVDPPFDPNTFDFTPNLENFKPNPNPEYCCIANLKRATVTLWTPESKNNSI